MKYPFIMALMLCLPISAHASLIFIEDFEDNTLSYNQPIPDALDDIGNRDYYGRVSSNDLHVTTQYQNMQGSHFYAVQDTNGALPKPTDTVTLLWENINISLWENLLLSWFIAEDDSENGDEDFDGNTAFNIDAKIDNGDYFNIFSVRSTLSGGGNYSNTAPAVDSNFDGVGDGLFISSAFQQFSANIGTGSMLDLKVSFINFNTQDEDFAFDSLSLTGDLKSPGQNVSVTVPEPSSILLLLLALMITFQYCIREKRFSS